MIPLKINTVTEKHRKYFENALKAEVNKEEFVLPTLASLVNDVPEAYEHFVRQYDTVFSEYKGYNQGTADTIKISQALLLDGISYGYNLTSGKFELFTADVSILNNMEGGTRGYDIKNILNFNKEGFVYAKRIDVNYNSLNGTYLSKATNLVGNKKLDVENYIFVPYIVIHLFIAMLVGLLQRGKVLEFGVQEGKVIKSRVSTLNKSVVSQYGSSPALESMPIIDLRLEGKIYIPVLGAPITTMGLSNIRFQNLSYLNILTKEALDSLNIKPADNSLDQLIRQEIISSFISRVFAEDDPSYKNNLYDLFKSSGASVSYNSSRLEYIKSLRHLNPGQFEHIWNSIEYNFRNYEGTAKELIKVFNPVVHIPRTPEEFSKTLKEGLYKITYLKPDGKFALVYATNNYDYLVKAYGTEFIKRKESHEDKLVYLKSLFKEKDWLLDNVDYSYYLNFLGLNKYLGSKTQEQVVQMMVMSSYPVIKTGELYDELNISGSKEVPFTGFDFSKEEDSAPTKGTADNRVKVRSMFNLAGSPIPFTRKIDPMSIYSMVRLDK